MPKTSKRKGWYPAPVSVYFPPSQRTEVEKLADTKGVSTSKLIVETVAKALKLKQAERDLEAK